MLKAFPTRVNSLIVLVVIRGLPVKPKIEPLATTRGTYTTESELASVSSSTILQKALTESPQSAAEVEAVKKIAGGGCCVRPFSSVNEKEIGVNEGIYAGRSNVKVPAVASKLAILLVGSSDPALKSMAMSPEGEIRPLRPDNVNIELDPEGAVASNLL